MRGRNFGAVRLLCVQAIFTRVIDSDPENVNAIVAKAVLLMNGDDAEVHCFFFFVKPALIIVVTPSFFV
jgi:hypothetical protein